MRRRTGDRSNAVVDTCHEQFRLAREPKRFVHDSLVVSNDIDTRKLRKHLHERAKHQPASPLRNLEHDHPPRGGDGLFRVNCHFNLRKLRANPVIICPVKVKLSQDLHGIF